jgi:hypothetical protein
MWSAFWKGFASHLRGPHRAEPLAQLEVAPEPAPQRDVTPGGAIKEPPMAIDGRVMSAEEFVRFVEGTEFPAPLPTRFFLHHTWKPTRADWAGHDTLMAMKAYYEKQLWQDEAGRLHEGWTAGPHLFVAEDGIWLFSDLRYDGVGVYGQNYRSRHLEMVGNYDDERPSGATLQNTIVALGILHEYLGLDIQRLNFHRDFASNTCPGRAVEKSWIIPLVAEWIADYRRKQTASASAARQLLLRTVGNLLVPANPNAALAKAGAARGLLGALTNEIPVEIDAKAYIVQFFADALIVPVNQWDKVQSLSEFEKSPKSVVAQKINAPEIVAPPDDPLRFEGKVR